MRVSDAPEPPAILRRLDFLAGSFRGEGGITGRKVVIEKRLEGTWEAGGHVLALRMTAAYLIGERVTDEHGALVVVGRAKDEDVLEADAYTDSGERLRYRIELGEGRLSFADRVPHESRAKLARKVLVPTASGYEEILEVGDEPGALEAWARVEMRRRS